MKQITITIGDDGQITVESSEGGEPYQCETIDECRQYVDQMLAEEGGEGKRRRGTRTKWNIWKNCTVASR